MAVLGACLGVIFNLIFTIEHYLVSYETYTLRT